jgi:hypothetical protein
MTFLYVITYFITEYKFYILKHCQGFRTQHARSHVNAVPHLGPRQCRMAVNTEEPTPSRILFGTTRKRSWRLCADHLKRTNDLVVRFQVKQVHAYNNTRRLRKMSLVEISVCRPINGCK